MLQADIIPEINEAAWQAWLKKNKAQDKSRYVRRLKVLWSVALFLTGSAVLWRFTG